jgi:hypothetical protein
MLESGTDGVRILLPVLAAALTAVGALFLGVLLSG